MHKEHVAALAPALGREGSGQTVPALGAISRTTGELIALYACWLRQDLSLHHHALM